MIDTAVKRRNAAAIGFPLPVSILPSGSFTEAVRTQIAWTYGGIAVGTGPQGIGHRIGLIGEKMLHAFTGRKQSPISLTGLIRRD